MRRVFNKIGGWRSVILIFYLWVTLLAYVVRYVDIGSEDAKKYVYIISIAEVLMMGLLFICPLILRFAKEIRVRQENELITPLHSMLVFLQLCGITFVFFLSYFIIFYPGSFSSDTISQYGQAIGYFRYSDWHPVLHTLFAFTLPLKLTNGWIGSIVLFQIICFSLSLAYAAYTVYQYGYRKYAYLFFAYILLNPATGNMAMYPWKDVSFAIAALLLMSFALHIYLTNGSWLDSYGHVGLFIVILTAATLFRYNGILFTLPLLLVALFYAKKLQKILLFCGICGLFLLVKFSLNSVLSIERAQYRKTEVLGVPLTMIGNAVKENPECLDQDILDFAYHVAPKERWEENTHVIFNSIKFQKTTRREIIEEAGYAKVCEMAFRCLKESPVATLRGIICLTDVVYGIAGFAHGVEAGSPIADNNFGIERAGFPVLQKIVTLGTRASRLLFKHIFWHIGVINLVAFVFILAKVKFNQGNDLLKLFFVTPLFIYNYGSMLVIPAPDFRYFYYTFLVTPLMVLLLLHDPR